MCVYIYIYIYILTHGRSDAVVAGVSATDDDHGLALGVDRLGAVLVFLFWLLFVLLKYLKACVFLVVLF